MDRVTRQDARGTFLKRRARSVPPGHDDCDIIASLCLRAPLLVREKFPSAAAHQFFLAAGRGLKELTTPHTYNHEPRVKMHIILADNAKLEEAAKESFRELRSLYKTKTAIAKASGKSRSAIQNQFKRWGWDKGWIEPRPTRAHAPCCASAREKGWG